MSPAGQGDHDRRYHEERRVQAAGDDARLGLQADRDRGRLDHGQHHGQVAGILVEGLAARLPAFLLQLLPRRIDRAHQLHDDRGADIGHDVQREDRHPLDGTAREHVEHAQDALGTAVEQAPESRRVNTGDRNIGAQPVDQQRDEREPDALVKFGRLLETTRNSYWLRVVQRPRPFRSPRDTSMTIQAIPLRCCHAQTLVFEPAPPPSGASLGSSSAPQIGEARRDVTASLENSCRPGALSRRAGRQPFGY